MINDLLLIIFFACLSSCISYALDYGLGKPGSDDISVSELFSGWTFMLAKRRLMANGMYEEIGEAFGGQYTVKDIYRRTIVYKEFKKTVIEKARDLWTWEKSVGGCIICSGWWVAVIISIIFVFVFPVTFSFLPKYLLLLTTPVFSHFILRKI